MSRKIDLAKNTLVDFTSDNGGLDNRGEPTDNAPLRSGKGYAYERWDPVPLIVRWPSHNIGWSHQFRSGFFGRLFPHYFGSLRCFRLLQIDRLMEFRWFSHLKSGGSESLNRSDLVWHFPHYRHDPGPIVSLVAANWKLIKYLAR